MKAFFEEYGFVVVAAVVVVLLITFADPIGKSVGSYMNGMVSALATKAGTESGITVSPVAIEEETE